MFIDRDDLNLQGNLALGNYMANISLGNLTLGKYTLLTFTLGNLALSLGNHKPGAHVLQQKLRIFSLKNYPPSKYFTQTAFAVSGTFYYLQVIKMKHVPKIVLKFNMSSFSQLFIACILNRFFPHASFHVGQH